VIHVRLREWEPASFETDERLRRVLLGDEASALATRLTRAGRLVIEEHPKGLRLTATSYVGRVEVGPVVVSVTPKIAKSDLLRLFAYAYDLADIEVLHDTSFGSDDDLFVDLLVARLVAEVRRLEERGLHRAYRRRHEPLASPRGTIDVPRAAFSLATGQTEVACTHHPRDEDHALHRALRAGLSRGATVARTTPIRLAAHRAASALGGVTATPATAGLLGAARRMMDRRTSHYVGALRLTEVLLDGSALDFEEEVRLDLPGFLFDMNRFWQELVERLLRDHLSDLTIDADRGVRGMLAYAPGVGHAGHKVPTARPDFVLRRGGSVVAVLDAKYRDLWSRELPSSMLYQLATYAVAVGADACATILYPTVDAIARDVCIEVRSPGSPPVKRATVVLRPVNVGRLVAVAGGSMQSGAAGAWVRKLAGIAA
jgi:5-methylcytosine-specific restriction enzyme subunit McrC